MTISAAGISRFPFNGCPGHEQVAAIAQVFLRNTFGDGLRALELRGGIKVSAILTGVQIGFALPALALVLNIR